MSLHEVYESKDVSSSASLLDDAADAGQGLTTGLYCVWGLMLTETDQMQDEGLLSLVWSDVIWR